MPHPKRQLASLKERHAFPKVLGRGATVYRCPQFVCLAMAWQYRHYMPRVGGKPLALGVVVSKKVDKRAVVRNRLRRRLKEGFRQGPWPALAAQVQAHYQPRQALWVVLVGREAGRSVNTSELQHHIAQAAVHLQRWVQQVQQPPPVGSS